MVRTWAKSPILFFGLAAGAIHAGWLLLFYFIDKNLLFNLGVVWSGLIFYLIAMVLACRVEAKTVPPPYPWQAALRTSFGTYLLVSACYYVFIYFFYNYFDPGIVALQREAALKSLEQYQDWFGSANTSQLRDSLRRENFMPSISSSLFAWVRSLLFGFPLCLFIAYVMRGK
jgi:hypothetical protein